MGIVLNEHEYAENAISQRTIGKKPWETLTRVARYYIDTNSGISKRDLRKRLDLFLIDCEPTASLPKWSNTIDHAIEWALKNEAIQIDKITITEPEMKIIDELKGKQLRRLAFVLLCLSKYWNTVNPNNDSWVNNKDVEIMAFANINTSLRRQCAMYATLKDSGLIRFSRKISNTNVRVNFAQDGDSVLEITDLRNLGYQYLKYHGEPYFECSNCGIVTKIDTPNKGRKQKYCKDCAAEIKAQQSIESMLRRRSAVRA